MFEEIYKPLINRNENSNKYNFGHVLILGGAPGMVGAPLLCGLGALRIGAGLVTIASSPEVIDKLEKRVLEIMTLRLAGDIEEQTAILSDFISDRRVSVLVAGTGFDKRQIELLKIILKKISIPIILDAGALTCFTDDLSALKMIAEKNTQIVATPHAGEFEKLTGIKLSKELPERIEQSKTASDQIKITIVAKGSPTIVVSPTVI